MFKIKTCLLLLIAIILTTNAEAQISPQTNSQIPEANSVATPNAQKNAQKYSYFLHGQSVSEDQYKAGILLNDGVVLLRANKNEEAASKFKEALSLSPNFPEVHHNLGVAMAKLGNVEAAIDELSTAVNLSPQTDASWYTLAGLYQSIGQIDKAISTYEQFLEKFPNSDMHKRISKLVTGLKNEQKNLDKTKVSPDNAPKIDAQAAQDDYLADVTAAGNYRWPRSKMPIKFYIHPATDVPGYKESYTPMVKQCFVDWGTASSAKVQFEEVASAKDAYIECFFIDDVSKMKNPAEAGEARVFTNKDGICRATIKLLTKSMSPILPLNDNRLRTICLHEIGHVLGLTGHTSNPKDVMFYSESFSNLPYQLSGRDQRTIYKLYSDY